MTLASKLQGSIPASVTTAPHLIIEALAGTGKTTTLVQALKGLFGEDPCMTYATETGKPVRLTPSPQQEAIWDCVNLSKGVAPTSVAFVAFNKSIATELQRRVPAGVSAMTMHS